MNLVIRKYEPADCGPILKLFYETVHSVNARDYSPEQLDAWADGNADAEKWNASFLAHNTVVALVGGEIAGFGDMDGKGYLDRLYVGRDYQGMGIASAICDTLEGAFAAEKFTTQASITAKPFFEKRGYTAVKEQTVERRGVLLTNYIMEKTI